MKKAPRTVWTQAMIDRLYAEYPDRRTEELAAEMGVAVHVIYHKTNKLGIKKSAAFLSSELSGRIAAGGDDKRGINGRFAKGGTSWNKGKKGWCPPGTVKTQFKKGHKPQCWMPIGSSRIDPDGYLQRKITDTGVTRNDFVYVHRLIWRWHGRELPKGYALVFKDGDRTNVDINNLELISRADLMKRNSIHQYPKEIAELVQLRGAITRQINKRLGRKQNGREENT